MEIQYDFDDLMDTSDFDCEFHSLERLAFSPEDSGDGDDSESIDSDLDKCILSFLVEKTDSCEEEHENLSAENLSPELFAVDSESSDGDWWEEACQAAEEMRRRCEQERMLKAREILMRRMRANYQMATDSFSAFEEEEDSEDWDEDIFGFNWRANKRAWLRDMPKSVSVPSNFRIVRTCVTEPDVVEVIVDFRRSNEL
jgi:hypothetical protein